MDKKIKEEDLLCLELCESEVWHKFLKPMLLSRMNRAIPSRELEHSKVLENAFRAAESKEIIEEVERRARVALSVNNFTFTNLAKRLASIVLPSDKAKVR